MLIQLRQLQMRARRLLIPREHFLQHRAHFFGISLPARNQKQPPVRHFGHAFLRKRAQRSIPNRGHRRAAIQLARRTDLSLLFQRLANGKQIALFPRRLRLRIERAKANEQRLERRNVLAIVQDNVLQQIKISGFQKIEIPLRHLTARKIVDSRHIQNLFLKVAEPARPKPQLPRALRRMQ